MQRITLFSSASETFFNQQVWFRVNEILPVELQKDLPDGSASAVDIHSPASNAHDEGRYGPMTSRIYFSSM